MFDTVTHGDCTVAFPFVCVVRFCLVDVFVGLPPAGYSGTQASVRRSE